MRMKPDVRLKLDFPKVDFTKDIVIIAQDIVIPLIKEGILTNTNIRGNSFPALSDETARRKGHSRPLQETGKLFGSFRRKVSSKNKVLVFIAGGRNKIAGYLQIDGVGRSKKKLLFMGVTQGMERDSMRYMKKVIAKWVRIANR